MAPRTETGKILDIKREVCPLSNLLIAPRAPDQAKLLVNGKTKTIFGIELADRLKKAGLPIPYLSNTEVLDIETWLTEQAKNIKHEPTATAGIKFAAITDIAQKLNIKTDFINQIRS
jgi:hypothetical protein